MLPSAPPCAKPEAAEEVPIPALRDLVLTFTLISLAHAPPLRAQDGKGAGEDRARVWQLQGLRNGFCVRFLLDPAKLGRQLPRETQLLRADAAPELHPALRRVIANQPEFASWSPSALCLYYLQQVEAGPVRTEAKDSSKAPVVALWTATAAGAGGKPRELALAFLSTDGDLRHAGREANVDFERLQSRTGTVPVEDGPPRPGEVRYELKLGKALLTWDGRTSDDTTRTPEPMALSWEAPGRRSGWVRGTLTLTPAASMPMVGSLRVQGNDPMALAMQASPIRFVGPAYHGGSGELRIGE